MYNIELDECFSYLSLFTQIGLIQVEEEMWPQVKCILTAFISHEPFKYYETQFGLELFYGENNSLLTVYDIKNCYSSIIQHENCPVSQFSTTTP